MIGYLLTDEPINKFFIILKIKPTRITTIAQAPINLIVP